jgi:hypothetical protein
MMVQWTEACLNGNKKWGAIDTHKEMVCIHSFVVEVHGGTRTN